MKSDNHIHSPYCPHGSNDSFEDYISRAIELGIKEITFTEHAPLPKGFIDTTPEKDSGMDAVNLMDYFRELTALKARYKGKILIKTGLEVDYIEGFEKETKAFLDQVGAYLDDSILSVHFIKHNSEYHCIDFSSDSFGIIAEKLGSIDEVYARYFSTVKKSIVADLGVFKPKRIGHITLVHKFQKNYRPLQNFDQHIYSILKEIRQQDYQLDYNGAGQVKPFCKEPYPPEKFARFALELGIPLLYGSDAHQAKDLGQGYEALIVEAQQ